MLVCLASCSTLWHHPRHLSCPCSLGTGVPRHCRAGVESRGVMDAALLSGLLTYACHAVYFNKGQLEMPLCPTAGRTALLHVQTLASHYCWAAACLIKPTRFGPPCTVLLRRTCGCVSTASKGPACAGCQRLITHLFCCACANFSKLKCAGQWAPPDQAAAAGGGSATAGPIVPKPYCDPNPAVTLTQLSTRSCLPLQVRGCGHQPQPPLCLRHHSGPHQRVRKEMAWPEGQPAPVQCFGWLSLACNPSGGTCSVSHTFDT